MLESLLTIVALRCCRPLIVLPRRRAARTIDHHLAAIFAKLGVATRAEAVSAAYRLGVISPKGTEVMIQMPPPTRKPASLIGFPTDRHSSMLRGPAKGPAAIRQALYGESGNGAAENGLELGIDLQLIDRGDAPLREADGDDDLIEQATRAAVREGTCPIALGGDHSVTYPIARALAAEFGALQILHIDAHPDLYDEFLGNRRSHASPFARIMEERLASRLVQVGIRTLNRHQREQARRFDVEIVPMRGFEPRLVPVLQAPLYVSIDLDGLDPAFAPGVSHPEPGGLSVRDVLNLLDVQQAPLVGADIVELNPDRDVNGMTAVVAAKLVKELAAYAVTACAGRR